MTGLMLTYVNEVVHYFRLKLALPNIESSPSYEADFANNKGVALRGSQLMSDFDRRDLDRRELIVLRENKKTLFPLIDWAVQNFRKN